MINIKVYVNLCNYLANIHEHMLWARYSFKDWNGMQDKWSLPNKVLTIVKKPESRAQIYNFKHILKIIKESKKKKERRNGRKKRGKEGKEREVKERKESTGQLCGNKAQISKVISEIWYFSLNLLCFRARICSAFCHTRILWLSCQNGHYVSNTHYSHHQFVMEQDYWRRKWGQMKFRGKTRDGQFGEFTPDTEGLRASLSPVI